MSATRKPTAPDAIATIVKRPLGQPTIDAVCAAAEQAKAHPVPVFTLRTGRIHEVGIWQAGEWVGSVFHWNRGEGLGAWSSVGNIQKPVPSAEAAVRVALAGSQDTPARRRL